LTFDEAAVVPNDGSVSSITNKFGDPFVECLARNEHGKQGEVDEQTEARTGSAEDAEESRATFARHGTEGLRTG